MLSLKYEYGLFYSSREPEQLPESVLKDKRILELSKEVALKSVIIERDKQQSIPLGREEAILLIEQADMSKFLNLSNYPGILYHNCLKYNRNITYLETDYTYDEDDLRRIK